MSEQLWAIALEGVVIVAAIAIAILLASVIALLRLISAQLQDANVIASDNRATLDRIAARLGDSALEPTGSVDEQRFLGANRSP